MKLTKKQCKTVVRACVPLVLLVGAGCSKMSLQIKDPSVGMNGGFEHTELGLPVNWLVYAPSTIPTGSYELTLDDTDFKEGKQSLKFVVQECSAIGGWQSPGIYKEYPATTGATYSVSFWVKSEGCDWVAGIGGVGAKTGHSNNIDSSQVTAVSWQHVELEYTLSAPYETICFGMSIRSPGTLWIDGVRIERITQEHALAESWVPR